MGWIEKNGKRQYRITKTVSHKLNKAGNEIGIRKEFFGNTKKEAEQKYKEFLENRALGVENQKQYFGVMADGFINEFFLPDGDLKDSTKNMYYRSWYKHIATADIYGLRLTDVTAKTIQQTYNNLSKEGVPASTIRKINNLMKRFYQYIVSEGYGRDITANISIPKTKTEKHKTSDTKITVWTDEEIKKIFSGFENADYRFRFRFLIVLAYYTGCRRSELLALTYDDITENGITINKQLGEITKDVLTHENVVRGYDITAPKTKNAYRTIPINEEVLKELHIHKQWHKAEQLKERYRTNYIFTSFSFCNRSFLSK